MHTVLVIEDDLGIQKQLKWSLSDYELVFASDRQQAMTQLRRFEPAVVTLDLGLPPDPANASEGMACLADIEDAVEKGLLSLPQLAQQLNAAFASFEPQGRLIATHSGGSENFAALLQSAMARADAEPINKNSAFFIKLRVNMIHPLVQHAAAQFIANIESVYHGMLNRALLEDDSQYHAITSSFKQVARQFVFNQPEVETLELQGFRIIAGLLDSYRPLLELTAGEFQAVLNNQGYKHNLAQRLAHRLPNKHVAAYQLALQTLPTEDNALELYYRCRLIQDFISGMTDHFAFDEYQTLVNCHSG